MSRKSSIIIEANQALISDGHHEAVPRFFATDYIVHLTDETLVAGHKLVRDLLDLYQRAFPNPEVHVEILVEGGDRVSWQRTLRARQEGAFKGFPASGREIVWRDVVTSRLQGDLIAEEWVISDLAEQLLRSRKKS